VKKKNSFNSGVYLLVSQIPPGKVSTYKEIAHALGCRAYRAVGQAMRRSPGMPTVPCHRVVKSDGTIGGFGGQRKGKKIENKIKMLVMEGVKFSGSKLTEFNKILIRSSDFF